MIYIDFDSMSDADIYHAFVAVEKEVDALNGSYPELVALIGVEATLKLFKYFRGGKIESSGKKLRAYPTIENRDKI